MTIDRNNEPLLWLYYMREDDVEQFYALCAEDGVVPAVKVRELVLTYVFTHKQEETNRK